MDSSLARAYVTNPDSNSVSMINANSNRVITTLRPPEVGILPTGIAVVGQP